MNSAVKITLTLGLLIGLVFTISTFIDLKKSEEILEQQTEDTQNALLNYHTDEIEDKVDKVQKILLNSALQIALKREYKQPESKLIQDAWYFNVLDNKISILESTHPLNENVFHTIVETQNKNKTSKEKISVGTKIVENHILVFKNIKKSKKTRYFICYELDKKELFKRLNKSHSKDKIASYTLKEKSDSETKNQQSKILVSDNSALSTENTSEKSATLVEDNLILSIKFKNSNSISEIKSRSFYVLLIGFLLMLLFIFFSINNYTKHVLSLSKIVETFGKDNSQKEIPYQNRKDEIGVLSNSFVAAQNNLTKFIQELKLAEQQKQKIKQEIAIAKQIQSDILGSNNQDYVFKGLQIQLFQESAKQVCGDLFKVDSLTEDEVFFAISDIADKGIPAAILMAKLLGAINITLKSELKDIGNIATVLNKELCENNPKCMFATTLLCSIHKKNKTLKIVNAGHPSPIKLNLGNGTYEVLKSTLQPAIGIVNDFNYSVQEFPLEDNVAIFAYTDGVTDAQNIEGEMFGEENLFNFMMKNTDFQLTQLAEYIENFKKNSEIADDLTMIQIKIP